MINNSVITSIKGVICMFGLPNQSKPIGRMNLYLTQNSFILEKNKTQYSIPYNKIFSFQVLKGLGDMRSAIINSNIYETVLEITYISETGSTSIMRIEIATYFSVIRNYGEMKNLLLKMHENHIFDKFIKPDGTLYVDNH